MSEKKTALKFAVKRKMSLISYVQRLNGNKHKCKNHFTPRLVD